MNIWRLLEGTEFNCGWVEFSCWRNRLLAVNLGWYDESSDGSSFKVDIKQDKAKTLLIHTSLIWDFVYLHRKLTSRLTGYGKSNDLLNAELDPADQARRLIPLAEQVKA